MNQYLPPQNVVEAYALCDAAAKQRVLSFAEAAACAKHYLDLKLSLLPRIDPGIFATLPPAERAKINIEAYAAYRHWHQVNELGKKPLVLAGQKAADETAVHRLVDEVRLRAIARWITETLDVPEIEELPVIRFASQQELAAIRLGRKVAADAPNGHSELSAEIFALYHDETRTIYLPLGWSGTSPAEVSILVHEMVHHVQNIGELKYACAADREKTAFDLQARLLAIFGRSLEDEFSIEPAALFVLTKCWR